MTRQVLLLIRNRMGPQMAGPGIRAVELARGLSATHSVRIAAPLGSEPVDPDIPLYQFDLARGPTLRDALRGVEVVVGIPLAPAAARAILDGDRRWIVDLHDPEPFEGLEFHRSRPPRRRRAFDVLRTDRLLFAARSGTAFICAGERQRDMWLGFLAAARRLNSDRYDADPTGRDLIDVIPFGLPATPPEPGSPTLRGAAFAPDARIILWNGGLWEWLDPLTVLRAVAILREKDDRYAVAFTSAGRPERGEHFEMGDRARRLAEELGLIESGGARFIDWTPYAERAQQLIDSDAVVYAHFDTMETRFATRVRALDALWARRPILCTEGDEWSEIVRTRDLGATVPPEDPESLAAAAEAVIERGAESYRASLDAVAADYQWPRIAERLSSMIDRVAELPPARAPVGARAVGLRHALAQRGERLIGRLPGRG